MKTILIKHENGIIPQPMIEKALKTCPAFLGIMSPNESGSALDVESLVAPDLPGVDELMGMQEANKTALMGFFLGASKGPIPEEDYQPYTLLQNDAKEVLLSVMLEGEYHNTDHANSPFSGEYHMVNDILRPHVAKLYRLLGGDLQKLLLELKDVDFHAIINGQAINRGVVRILACDGTVVSIDKGNALGYTSEEWGEASNCFGYAEKSSKDVAPEKEVVAEKPKSRFSGAVKAVVAAVTPAVVVKKEAPSPLIDPKDNASPTAIDAGIKDDPKVPVEIITVPEFSAIKDIGGEVHIQCPTSLLTKKDRHAWFKAWTVTQGNGEPVPGYKNIPGPFAKANVDFLNARAGIAKDFKDMRTKVDEANRAKKAPIMSPELIKSLKIMLNSDKAKASLANGQVLDSAAMKSNKLATFTEQLADIFPDITSTFRIDYELLKMLPQDALAQLALEWKLQAMDAVILRELLKEKGHEFPKEGAPNPVKKEEAKPTPAAAPKSRFAKAAA